MKRTPLRRSSPLRQRTPLPRQSRKRRQETPLRQTLVASLLDERPVCEVPWCHNRSEHVHEPLTRARGGSILDPANCRAVCGAHHDEIHGEPDWAYQLGFLRHSWDAA